MPKLFVSWKSLALKQIHTQIACCFRQLQWVWAVQLLRMLLNFKKKKTKKKKTPRIYLYHRIRKLSYILSAYESDEEKGCFFILLLIRFVEVFHSRGEIDGRKKNPFVWPTQGSISENCQQNNVSKGRRKWRKNEFLLRVIKFRRKKKKKTSSI